jgi:ABC-type glycerol-3-phosphate transport system substrate-binding protein
MKLSWRISALFACFLIALAAGCEGNRPGGRELVIALAVFPGEAAHYRSFVSDFERREHVHVEIVAQSYDDILRALRAEASAEHGRLDLAELDLAMLGEAQVSVRSVDEIAGASQRALFPDSAWQAATTAGHLYFIPHRLMWQAMIYNRVEVPHPPRTWAELQDFARLHPGKLALKGARYEGNVCDVMPFVWSAGGDELVPGSAGSLRALDFIGSLAPDLNPESAVFREMSVLEAQARGSVWIHFNWPFAMGYLAGKGLAPQVDLSAPIPSGPDGTATPLGGGYLAISRSAPHPELAAAFLKYLLTPEAQTRLSRELGWYWSVAPASGSAEATLYTGFTAMRPYVRARPVICNYAKLSNLWQNAVREVLFGNEAPRAELEDVAARFKRQGICSETNTSTANDSGG